ncbi:MAG: GNAT family N-acetyltransferase [Chloroflexales bacterium]|nr:GNAT family N-acetyltransferase [Chloroflexales bacterium]
MNLHIRLATIDDIPAIQAVGAAAWRDTYPGLVPDGYLDDGFARAWARDSFERSLANPRIRLLVAEYAGAIVGMIQLGWHDDGIADLWRLYLLREQRGRGLGRRLWEAVTAELPPFIRTFRTSVVRGNPALRFYRRLGFDVTHEDDSEYVGYQVPLTYIERPVHGANTLSPTDQTLVERDYATSELHYNAVMAPAYRDALTRLALPRGSCGLDLGCGPGGLLPLLAEHVGPEGRIIGVDVSRPHLAAARRLAEQHGIASRVRLKWVDLARPLPFADKIVDWVWSADVLWPGRALDPLAAVCEAARVTRPSGRVAVWFIAWERSLFLPGEAQLNDALRRATFATIDPPAPTPLSSERALGWLRSAGLTDLQLSVHPVLLRPPFSAAAQAYLEGYVLAELRQVTRDHTPELDDATWARWERLRDPESPDYLFTQPDYYCVQFGLVASGMRCDSG